MKESSTLASLLEEEKVNTAKLSNYNIHNIITVVSVVALPELEPFCVEAEIAAPTVRVQIGSSPKDRSNWVSVNSRGFCRLSVDEAAAAQGVQHILYDESLGPVGFRAEITLGDTIQVFGSSILAHSPHVLYTNVVEPILRWTFVTKGFALVHGACVAFGDKAYLVTARTDTGKTTTLLLILNQQRRGTDSASFISDDLTLVSPDGCVLTYPKPMTISAHTLRAVNAQLLARGERLALPFQSRIHSRDGRRFALAMTQTNLPMASVNAWVQRMIPPPKYDVKTLVPRVKMAREAKLAGMFVIERGEDAILPLDSQEALETLLKNCDDAYGFPPYYSIKDYLINQNGGDRRQVERQIITDAFAKLPATLIRSKDADWWRLIPGYVDESIAAYFPPRQASARVGTPKTLQVDPARR
jgi:dolichol-phosphate mannosyltransferase